MQCISHNHRSWQTRTGKATLVAAAAGVSLAIGAAAARADVRYTTETQMGSGNAADAAKMPTLRSTTYIKGKRERMETAMEMGAMKSNTVTLTLCDQRQIITMDPDLKLYTVAPIEGGASGQAAAPAGQEKPSNEKSDTGRVITTYNIQDLGTEKVGSIDARHFMVTMRMERSGCAGKGDNTMKMETWVAPGQLGALDCEERVPSAAPRELRNDKNCRITFETKGDTGMLKNVFHGIVVRKRMYNGDKVAMTQEVKNLSSDALNESLFAPPSDFKQVSQQEYAEAKRKAQMAALGASGGESAPAPKRRRGGLLGGLGGALGGAIPGLGGGNGLGGLGAGVLSGLGGQAGLGGIANLLGSGMLGGLGGMSPVPLPGSAGQALSLLGSLMDR